MSTIASRTLVEARCNLCGWSETAPRDAPATCPQCNGICPTCFSPSDGVMQDDMTELMRVLGISVHARPCSPHEVMVNEIIPAVRRLVQ
jgi:Zn finger protein HypA/HybF involved in hydrogenase expression